MEDIHWLADRIAPFVDMIGVGTIVRIFGMGVSIWKSRQDVGATGMGIDHTFDKEIMDSCGRLDTLLTIIRAQGGDTPAPYRMQEDDKTRMKDIICISGHLVPELLELYAELLAMDAQADADHTGRSSVLERMHKLARSKYEDLRGQYSKAV